MLASLAALCDSSPAQASAVVVSCPSWELMSWQALNLHFHIRFCSSSGFWQSICMNQVHDVKVDSAPHSLLKLDLPSLNWITCEATDQFMPRALQGSGACQCHGRQGRPLSLGNTRNSCS